MWTFFVSRKCVKLKPRKLWIDSRITDVFCLKLRKEIDRNNTLECTRRFEIFNVNFFWLKLTLNDGNVTLRVTQQKKNRYYIKTIVYFEIYHLNGIKELDDIL